MPSAEVVAGLRAWVDANGWTSYDPYDIRGTRAFIALQRIGRSRARRIPLRSAIEAAQVFPLASRRLLGVRPAVNAHGIGLLAAAYWTLEDEAEGRRCLNWLAANNVSGHPGLGWGYPFDWQSLAFIPRGTPSGFVSVVAGDAFWRAYRAGGDDADLAACVGVCEFLADALHRTVTDAGICFGYTTADDLQVHNTNLLAAEFLDRVGREVGRGEWLELAASAASFTLAEQRPDGAIEYWARAQPGCVPGFVDHYHTGNSLRSLHRLWQHSGETRYRDARNRLFAYYRERLWRDEIPLTHPDRLRPIDIHACAEAIHCTAVLADELPEAVGLGTGAVRWTLDHMRTYPDRFGHLLVRRLGRDTLTGIPYLRWSQAPMLLALAAHLETMPHPSQPAAD
ncbi:MAG TPA: hypothetical protein VMU73_05030 [Gaiellaceae bacterium]|nr:hypothetical protein [Gaiellaceae bacterium]